MIVTDASARAPGPGPTAMHALVHTLGRKIAIPSQYVMQAVEAPPELTQIPRRSGAIDGVMTIDGQVMPVISLARWLGSGLGADSTRVSDNVDAIERPHGLVLLLKDGNASIGLGVEAVIGTQRIRPDEVRRLFHDDDPEELFQSAALFGNDTAPTCILEPRRLMALAGAWVADAALDTCSGNDASGAPAAAANTTLAAQRATAVTYATFRIGDTHVALPGTSIGELLRRPRLRDELLRHDGVLGLCEWRDRLVPVVDLAGALHALPAGGAGAWVCIICDGELAIGIVMDDVQEMVQIAHDTGAPVYVPDSEPSVVARRLLSGERTLQVIDVALLLHRYTETAISAKGASAARLRTAVNPTAPAYMVFDAGGMFAAQIDGVQEVVTLPDELRARLNAGVSTTLQWRKQPVPVMAIADGMVTLQAQDARQLIIIRQDKYLAALPIAGVKAMVQRGIAHRNRLRIHGRPMEVISVETNDHRASYPVIDLCQSVQGAV